MPRYDPTQAARRDPAQVEAMLAESQIIARTEREIAAAIESLTEQYPATAHPAIMHAARVALGNTPERWCHRG
ncbi:hypothetical protein BDK92_7077 [Micromonospora pisi]|uniref:Uncharacterized protein n=1 Tax=Micromonospora pisi TaxID=589240 RepID=A0A495JVR8_9ACTN|nr:hypothetical protein [Micromonospora pisi]RKR92635.1 hypothetical protein BDK92_7077 [Micromonospora pisi]